LTPGVKNILIATAFFALMNVGVKFLDRIPAHEIVFFRALISLVFCYGLLRKRGIYPWGNNKKYLILRGISGTAALLMYFYTLQHMPLASAVTIQYLSPIFTILIAGLFLGEHPSPWQYLFFAVSFGGVLMIKGFDPRVTPVELVIGISAAVLAGFAYNFIRKLKDYDDPLVVVLYFPLVTVPAVGLYTAFHWVQPIGYEWLVLIGIGVATTFAQIYMTRAYQMERAANVSNYNYLGSVYAIFIGLFLFGETISLMAILGIGLIVGGVMMSSRFRRA
jgi:drug/metabolite transporter (DMT)-like permease